MVDARNGSPFANAPSAGTLWQTRPAGDIAFATLPPYMIPRGWLAIGIPMLSTVLDAAGISSRIIRFTEGPEDDPPAVMDVAIRTMFRDPSVAERHEAIRAAASECKDYFELMLSRLLAGPERIFGLSIWRLNVDVSLEIARRIKEQRPDAMIVLGGPETIADAHELRHDWVDVIVRGPAEGVIVPVARALLDRRPADAAVWDNVWVHPRHEGERPLARRHAPPTPIPRINYAEIMPMLVGTRAPTVPVLMNIGCPFRCGFCTNTNIYPDLEWGQPDAVVGDMIEITRQWKSLHAPGQAPGLEIFFCDAALNAQPGQYDRLCKNIIAADWPLRPSQISSMIVIDGRMTTERIGLARDAGFRRNFVGLESASDRIRREMKKPGLRDEVTQALQLFADMRWEDALELGIIVGWPGETEEEFFETFDLLDWATSNRIAYSVNAALMMKTKGMMDSTLLATAGGEQNGLLWHLPVAAGSPSVRARRYLHTYEHFAGAFEMAPVVPHDRIIDWMLPAGASRFWQGWIDRQSGLRQPEYRPPAAEAQTEAPDSATEGDAEWTERELCGRGATVTLRLGAEHDSPALAHGHAHSFAYAGNDLPEPLRGVILALGREIAGCPDEPLATEALWAKIEGLIERIAPDVKLAAP